MHHAQRHSSTHTAFTNRHTQEHTHTHTHPLTTCIRLKRQKSRLHVNVTEGKGKQTDRETEKQTKERAETQYKRDGTTDKANLN